MKYLKNLKRKIFKYTKYIKQSFSRIYYKRFEVEDISIIFNRLNLKQGDKIFIHSGVSNLCNLKPDRIDRAEFLNSIIKRLYSSLTPDGTIILPSYTIQYSSKDYWNSYPIFDIKKTPGRYGFLTEVFRNYPGVQRSTHPSESVVALGNIPKYILNDHYKYACNPESEKTPFGWLLNNNGFIVHLGIRCYERISFLHYIDSKLNSIIEFNHILKEPKFAQLIVNNKEIEVEGRAYNTNLTRHYNRKAFIKALGKMNITQIQYKGIPFSSINLKPAYDRAFKIGLNQLRKGYLPPWYGKKPIKIRRQ